MSAYPVDFAGPETLGTSLPPRPCAKCQHYCEQVEPTCWWRAMARGRMRAAAAGAFAPCVGLTSRSRAPGLTGAWGKEVFA